MASRTNKMGIFKKKMLQQKQKKLVVHQEIDSSITIKKEFTNPLEHKYMRFFRSGKYINDITSVREDPDGYRVVRRPNAGEIIFEKKGNISFGFKRWLKKSKRLSRN